MVDGQQRMMAKGVKGGDDFAHLFEESFRGKQFIEGEIVEGEILKINHDFVIVDIGYKSEGAIPKAEFLNRDGKLVIKPGDKVEVLLEKIENDLGQVVLSKHKADVFKAWEEISEAAEKDQVVEGVVISKVKGGLAVDIGVKAFLPASQVDIRPPKNLSQYLGQNYKFKVIKINKKRGNIVLSRRAVLERELQDLKTTLIDTLAEGNIVEGVVKNITDYGAFVDLGGIDGLLHITDMSWGRIKHPSEVLAVSDRIRVKVLKYDPEKGRVSLGLKQIQPDPWSAVKKRYKIGGRVTGTVVSLTDYGAFVEVEKGVEGLIHVSEMSWTQRVKHPSQVLNVGTVVDSIILDIDVESRRISLGLKQIEPNPWTILRSKYPIGSRIKGKIRSITDFGVFVGVEEGIDGLVHVSDISWTKKNPVPSEMFQIGQEVEAVILNIDDVNEKFSLGFKQLERDIWTGVGTRYPVGTLVEGKIAKIADFGVFLELEEGIEGLIHVSELARERVSDPRQLFKEGDSLRAEVIHVDTVERKISLSVRAILLKEERDALDRHRKEERKAPSFGDLLGDKLKKSDDKKKK